MSTKRLFIALPLPAAVRDLLATLAQPLPGVTWGQPAQLHVTLRFLGEIDEEQIAPLAERLGTIRVEPFLLPLEGVGAFPPKRPPRVLWAGIGSGHPRLHQLRQRVDDHLLAGGFEVELRPFHPHVTLARCGESAARPVPHWLHLHRDFVGPIFQVEEFGLYSSDLRPGGAVHSLEQRFPLQA